MLYEIELLSIDRTGSLSGQAQNFFRWFADQGCRMGVHVRKYGEDRVILRLELHRGRSRKSGLYTCEQLTRIFGCQLAEFLAEHILKEWEPYFTEKYVEKYTAGLSEAARTCIREKSLYLLQYGEDSSQLPESVHYEKSCRLCERIRESLEQLKVGQMNLEGFVRFRMKDFLREVEHAVQLSERCWENDREYEEFVLMMRDYVQCQAGRERELHFACDTHGGFRLWNEHGEQLQEALLKRKKPLQMAEEDILLSFLLTSAPEKIVWHIGQEMPGKRVLKILQDVFRENLHFCTECCLCRSLQSVRQYHPEIIR